MSDPKEQEVSLLGRCRRRQPEAWTELFTEYYPSACRFIIQLNPDFQREDVEEVAQETFLSVVKGLDTFNGSCRFVTWLYRIAANKARDHRDRAMAARRGRGIQPVSLDAVAQPGPDGTGTIPEPVSPTASPDQALLRRERVLRVHDALGELGEGCREILELRYFGDLSYEDIAEALELNEKTVSSRLSRCLDSLGGILESRDKLEDGRTVAVKLQSGNPRS